MQGLCKIVYCNIVLYNNALQYYTTTIVTDVTMSVLRYNDYNAVMMMYDWLLDNKMNIDNDVLAKFEQIRYQNLPVSLFGEYGSL